MGRVSETQSGRKFKYNNLAVKGLTSDITNMLINVIFFFQTSDGLVYFLDAFVSHYFMLTLTIVSWRSMWNVYGHFFYPNDAIKSDWMALILGYVICSLLLALEQILRKITRKIEEYYKGRFGGDAMRLLWEDFIYIIVFPCHILLWRGMWNLNARYLYPDPLWGGLVNNLVGTALLMVLQLFSYASAVGCAVDGAETNGLAFWPTRYLRHYQHRRGLQTDELDDKQEDGCDNFENKECASDAPEELMIV